MDLLENPFHLLEVTTRDQRNKIVLAAEGKSLLLDPEVCNKAQTTLINPSQRLSAEVSWLPGLSPGKVDEIIKKISTSPIQGINNLLRGLPHLAYCNLATSYINQVSFKDNPEYLVQWISYIVNYFKYIDYNLLLNFINEDRTVAHFPLIQNIDDIERELYNHKDYLGKIFKASLDKIPNPDIHLTELLKEAIQNHDALPLLLDDLTELYHIEVQKYLDELANEIDQMISSLQNDLTETKGVLPKLYERIDTLEGTLKTWAQIAKPMNLVIQNSGLEDENSIYLAGQIRGLAVVLANEYDLHAEARLLTCLIGEVFEKVPQVFEKINEDLKAIDDILSEKDKAKKEAEEWKKEISLDIEIGFSSKNRLIITPESISYAGVSLPLEKITGVRWGILVHITNGIETRTDYDIWIETPDSRINIDFLQLYNPLEFKGPYKFNKPEQTSKQQYELILEKLWKTVVVRLIDEILKKLSQGDKLTYGNIIVDKNGILLKKKKLFWSEPYYAKWEDLTMSNGPGVFVITATKERKAQAKLDYREINNVRILEAVMRYLWKDGNYAKLRNDELL